MLYLKSACSTSSMLHSVSSGTRQDYLNATKLLLAAGSTIADSRRARCGFVELLHKLLAVGDASSADLVVDAFAHRRRHLQKLAEIHLPRHLWHRNGEDPDRLLDEQAFEVVLALSKSGVDIVPACTIPQKQTTIWHCLTSGMGVTTAQKLFDAGFRDIEGHDDQRHTPLTSMRGDGFGEYFQIAEWFCDHGANLLCDFPHCGDDCTNPAEHQRPRRLKSIHSFACLGSTWGPYYYLRRPIRHSDFLATTLNSSVTDGCACACSEQGCVPGVNVFGRVLQFRTRGNVERTIPWKSLASRLSSAFNTLFMALIRLWTFEALDMTHTCCRHGCANYESQWNKPCPFSTPTDYEIQEIQDEEQELISFHEALMMDFTDTWLASTKSPRDFLSKVWRPRLEQIRRERAKLSEEEIVGFSRIGVRVETDDTNILQGVQGDDGDIFDDEDLSDDGDLSDDDDPSSSDEVSFNDEEQYEDGSDGDIDQGSGSDDEENPDKVEDLASGSESTSNANDRNTSAGEQQGPHDGCDNGQTIDGIDDVEVAEILKEAARVNGLEDYDVWFKMIGKPDPRRLASEHI
jgi:hypothetical protein